MLYGRDPERAEIGALLEAARDSRSGALVLRGEPGIGKTALLADARDQAGDMHVLTARGVESESELPFAALDQLLRPVLDPLDRLPAPQAAALRGALGLADSVADERFLVSAACLSLLSELAERRPVLCLVDDAHWLDTASANALLFVARRVDAEGIVMLFAAREGEVRGFDAPGLRSLTLEGLDAEAATTLITHAARAAAAPVRKHLIEQARGNALALVELPSALSQAQLRGEEPLPELLPLSRQVESLFLERVRRMSPDTQSLLLLAAADDSEDAALVTRSGRTLGVDPHALDAAEQAGLLSVHGNRLEFRHPLVRSAVYEGATSGERREAHRALAEALAAHDEQSDRRAWHLAASVLEHDEGVVRALEDAAERAQRRGGYAAAARALARAAELSADGQSQGARLVAAVRAARIAGADDYATALANQALPLVDDPLLRAEIAYALGVVEFRRGRPPDGFSKLIGAASTLAAVDPRQALEVLIWATGAASLGGNPAALAEVSKVADTVTSGDGASEARYVVQALATFAHAMGPGTANAGELDEAVAWASTSDYAQHVFAVGVASLWVGNHQHFAALIDRATVLARARGEFGILAEALTMRSGQLLMAQRFEEAALAAREAVQFAREIGSDNAAARALGILTFVAAVQGDEKEARETADEVLATAIPNGLQMAAAAATYGLAMLELGFGRWTEALERLERLADARGEVGNTFLAKFTLPDVIEAAVRADRLEQARHTLAVFEEWVTRGAPLWAQPRLASCRALLADGASATAHFEEALALSHDARAFDLPRMQLLYGEHLRRQRRRTDSRVHLRAALEGFERFRARPWVDRARAELRASGQSARKRDPSTRDRLTPQEVQIARLVAGGLANKEVAAQLYLSPRTIDYHLRNVFSKLGLTSRTQLAGIVLGEPEPLKVPVAS